MEYIILIKRLSKKKSKKPELRIHNHKVLLLKKIITFQNKQLLLKNL